MGFWDKLDKALETIADKAADGADRAVTHLGDDLDSTIRGGNGAPITGLGSTKKDKPGSSFSWGAPNTEKDDKAKKDEGFSWW